MPPSVFFQKCSDNYQILTTFEAPNGEHSFSLPEILIRQKNIEKCLFKEFSTQRRGYFVKDSYCNRAIYVKILRCN